LISVSPYMDARRSLHNSDRLIHRTDRHHRPRAHVVNIRGDQAAVDDFTTSGPTSATWRRDQRRSTFAAYRTVTWPPSNQRNNSAEGDRCCVTVIRHFSTSKHCRQRRCRQCYSRHSGTRGDVVRAVGSVIDGEQTTLDVSVVKCVDGVVGGTLLTDTRGRWTTWCRPWLGGWRLNDWHWWRGGWQSYERAPKRSRHGRHVVETPHLLGRRRAVYKTMRATSVGPIKLKWDTRWEININNV